MMRHRNEFYVLAGMIGLVQGGIQALSRSYYARLIPLERSAEYYGFYDMMGKFAVIVGPAMMGAVGLGARKLLMPPVATVEQMHAVGQLAARISLGSICILFLIGGLLLHFVDEARAREDLKCSTLPSGASLLL